MTDFSFISHTVDQVLRSRGLEDAANSSDIARFVSDGTTYWEKALPDGSHLALIRLFSPIVRREEIFLGNVLLNDFLSKALIRAANGVSLGCIAFLANDLESYYYLYNGKSSLEEIAERFREVVAQSLPELYLGDESIDRGIHGGLDRMLTFYKSNIEPFPAFSIPRLLLPDLLVKANNVIRRIAAEKESNINVLLSVLSFFYARNGAEMQSVHAFLDRAISEGMLHKEDICAAFALNPDDMLTKDAYMERKKGDVIDRPKLKECVDRFLLEMDGLIMQGPTSAEEVAPYLSEKMLPATVNQIADSLLSSVQLGFFPFLKDDNKKSVPSKKDLPCRFCGSDRAVIVEKNITGGFGAGRFYNQSSKGAPFQEALCARCGVSSYLVTKLLGMHNAKPQPKSKDYPVPRQYHIIFHYGKHDAEEVIHLQNVICDILDLIGEFRRSAIEKKQLFSLESLKVELVNRAAERRAQETIELLTAEDALAALIADDETVPGLEILAQIPQNERAQILPLGLSDYRLLVLVLPRLQHGTKEGLDFVNHRFSCSRLAAFTLLAFLRKLCGCDGPYYFQSVPALSSGGFNYNTFYVCGVAENADEVIRRYSTMVNFARRVSKYRDGHSLLADWILLAERLEDKSLETFSDILRRSSLRGGDDLSEAKFKRLSNEFVKGTAMIDGMEYLKLAEQLKRL